MKDLKKKKQILEDNIKYEKDMVDNNKSYDNKEQNVSYGPNHFKQAMQKDEEELDDTKKKINTIKKVEEFKKAAKEALSEKKKSTK